MTSGQGVLVIAEAAGLDVKPVTLELVTAGRNLADNLDQQLLVGVFGSGAEVGDSLASVAGVDVVATVTDANLAQYTNGAWTAAAAALIQELNPSVVLIPGTTAGRDFAPRLAARLETRACLQSVLGGAGVPVRPRRFPMQWAYGRLFPIRHSPLVGSEMRLQTCPNLAADCVDLQVEDGALVAIRPVLGGRVQTAVRLEGDGCQIATVRPGSFARADTSGGSAEQRNIPVTFDNSDLAVQVIELREQDAGEKHLDEAERIVAGGRGLKEPANFSLVEDLAKALDAAVGASRAVVDAGWRPHHEQVGQTGQSVTPRLYVAVGISGAVQHLVGMQNADYIVAINRDADAPIFKIASFGIVGDLFEVVPAVIAELQATGD